MGWPEAPVISKLHYGPADEAICGTLDKPLLYTIRFCQEKKSKDLE